MLLLDGYGLTYDKARNRVTVTLPQTALTVRNSEEPVAVRRTDVEETELFAVLLTAKCIFENGEGKHERAGQITETAAGGEDPV